MVFPARSGQETGEEAGQLFLLPHFFAICHLCVFLLTCCLIAPTTTLILVPCIAEHGGAAFQYTIYGFPLIFPKLILLSATPEYDARKVLAALFVAYAGPSIRHRPVLCWAATDLCLKSAGQPVAPQPAPVLHFLLALRCSSHKIFQCAPNFYHRFRKYRYHVRIATGHGTKAWSWL